jgi:hypothetical protein
VRKSEIFSLGHSDLNGFLFSTIGREPSGVTLSVVSFLARLDVDPWREAGRLATLPRDTAKEWLAQTIASAPTSIWSLPEANVIAARLVTLLPRRATRKAGVVNRLVSVLRGSGTGDRDF